MGGGYVLYATMGRAFIHSVYSSHRPLRPSPCRSLSRQPCLRFRAGMQLTRISDSDNKKSSSNSAPTYWDWGARQHEH